MPLEPVGERPVGGDPRPSGQDLIERAGEKLAGFRQAVAELRPMILGGDYDVRHVQEHINRAESAGADVTELRKQLGDILKEGGTTWRAACEVNRSSAGVDLTRFTPSSSTASRAAPSLSSSVQQLSTSGGLVKGYDFSGIKDGIYEVGGGQRWLIVRGDYVQSFGPPDYDLPYMLRAAKELSYKGPLVMDAIPKEGS